ncbi:ABC transporter permease [Saccharopolyspora shandongensis]|uniref:ABC transporter permease n=1 Tax=Saccharopolyspora shandongensis TaxID=418495 RepID=UPI0033DFD6FB
MAEIARDVGASQADTTTAWSRGRAGREFWKRMRASRSGVIGMVLLIILIAVALFAPVISPFSPDEIAGRALRAPSSAHLMGTDNVGRDVFSVVLHGTRIALLMGLVSAALALLIGAVVGGIAGYAGGHVETLLMRVTEIFQIVPLMVLALFVVALWGSHLWLLVIAVTIAIWPLEARIVYAQVKSLKNREFVQVARVAGASHLRILGREILPNALPPVIVQVSLDAGLAILTQTSLGFLGLGDPNTASWGQLLYAAQDFLSSAWWMSVFPGLAVALAIVAFSLLGDGMNEIYNPHQRRGTVGASR